MNLYISSFVMLLFIILSTRKMIEIGDGCGDDGFLTEFISFVVAVSSLPFTQVKSGHRQKRQNFFCETDRVRVRERERQSENLR